MKTIFSCDLLNVPYKITISDDVLLEISDARMLAKNLPWSCNLYIPTMMMNIKTKHNEDGFICVGEYGSTILINNDSILEKDILSIPDVYLTNTFKFNLIDIIFSLDEVDIELIARLKQ